MANNPLDLIAINKEKIKESEMDTVLLYEELGRCVSDRSLKTPIKYCEMLITDYILANEEFLRLKRKQDQFKNIEKNSKSLEKEYRLTQKNLNINEKKIKDLFLRIGAAIYEGYGSNTLKPELTKLLDPIFLEKQKKVKMYELKINSSTNILVKKIYKHKLKKLRLNLVDTFYQASILLEKNSCIKSLPLRNKDAIIKEYLKYKNENNKLNYSLKIFKSELDRLKKDGSEDVKSKLEELKITVKIAKESSKDAAILVGTELYKILPDDITSEVIGESAIDLIDQITLHKSVIANRNKDIELLKNELKVIEIKSQIEVENSNIDRLQLQIETCKDKISTIEDTIANKKIQIDVLVKEGVYIEKD